MRATFLSLALLVPAVPIFAQGPPTAGEAMFDGSIAGPAESVWLRGEYLGWATTTRRGLESARELTGNPLVNTLLTATGTTEESLFQAALEGRRGYRLTAGAWLDPDGRLGAEVSAFWLRRSPLGTPLAPAALFGAGLPGLTGAAGGGAFAIPVGLFGVAAATVQLDLGDQEVYNFEALGRAGLFASDGCRVDALLGARCLVFDESLFLSARATVPGADVLIRTGIDARTRYVGGVIGLDGEVWHGGWFVGARPRATVARVETEVTPRTALQATLPVVGPVGFNSAALGDLTQRDGSWTVLPELDLRAGRQIGEHLRVMVGASILALPNAARASGRLNPGLPLDPAGLLVPPPRETVYLLTASAGIELRF